jgi:sarcosine oxidase subunit alpha
VPFNPRVTPDGPNPPITFTFDERPIEAYEGDTVAAALFAVGVRIFSRSFKYHRPRGLLCCAGRCPNCLMNVDGTPNVRTCVTPVRAGMQVRHQNAWPSLERDALSVIGRIERLLPVGFYYKTFIHPRALWPVYEHVLRNVGGIGVVQRGSRPEGYHHEYRTTEIAVIGGGPAGMAAALAAAQAGCRVVLVEEQDALGGMLRVEQPEQAVELAAAVEAAGVTVWTGGVAFGAYEGRQLGVQRGKTLVELRYGRLVLATGAFERPALFAGNDLPGIMLGTGAQRLLRLYGVLPGRRAVVATSHDGGVELAAELASAGVEVAAVVDSRPVSVAGSPRGGERPWPSHTEATVARAFGGRHLAGVEITTAGGASHRLPCDLLCLSLGWEPGTSLLAQAAPGAGNPGALRWDETRGVYGLGEGEDEVLAAGSVAGAATLDQCLALGEAAGRAAADGRDGATRRRGDGAGGQQDGVRRSGPEETGEAVAPRDTAGSALSPRRPVAPSPRHCFVCLCEDVTEKDIAQAVAEGFDHIETLKRYATASMGPCQGKMCRAAVSALCARETGQSAAQVGLSRSRPPAQPVTLGALGAAHAAPVRLTPMHHRHVALGARFLDMGEWKRPEVYTSVAEECRAVREHVGLIDVSTLGKLEVVGRDAPAVLDRIYTNRCSDLRPGRVRYGVICDDAGIIMDDGTFARLGEERWFLTTTTGGVEAMDQSLRWWAVSGPGEEPHCLHVTNRTAGLAAVNLAGPRSRELLAPLTDLDLSAAAFPYLAAREGTVAAVPALLLRIGFVGELGYEIHYPAEYGAALWDTLLEAGRAFGILPFGVEAQRILRLEKQHLIVGHDTDALSNPLDAGMPWVVKWDKGEFVGRPSLLRVRSERREGAHEAGPDTLQPRLVGFEIADRTVVLPEGSQVVQEGRPVGRVTSYRSSPTLGKGIGLAWVPEEAAREGAWIQIAGPAGQLSATVTLRPFYDPEGRRVRG